MHVLIADDDAANRKVLSAMLGGTASHIVTFEHGQEVLDYLAQAKVMPDLILLDVMMPVLDGILTAKAIHKKYDQYWLPIIFMSDDDSSSILKTCLTYGDDVITKPVVRRILNTRVALHADKAQRFNGMLRQYEDLQKIQQQQEYEHSVTCNIFSKLMKECDENAGGIRFYTSPSSIFNGDILQVLPRPHGGQYILLGDITGHGLPAAICTIPVARTFSSMCKKWKGVGSIAQELNRVLLDYLPDGMMCAATLIELPPGGEEIHIWSGGLPDILVLDSQGKVCKKISSSHMPLGVLDDSEFEIDVTTVSLKKDRRLILYTDGITESKNSDEQFYGDERLELACVSNCDDPFNGILRSIEQFAHGSEQQDDISLIEIAVSDLSSVYIEEDLADIELVPVPWQMQLSLTPELMRTFSPVPWLISVLKGPLGEISALDVISTVFSELYNNALEHGVLGLTSELKSSEEGFFQYYEQRETRLNKLIKGQIDIELQFINKPRPSLIAKITDSGRGFDYKAVQEKLKVIDNRANTLTEMQSVAETHGRGLLLLNSLCSKVEHCEQGQCVIVTFELEQR